LTAYHECAKLFQNEEVLEKFDILRELSKVHNIENPENLKVLFTDTLLSKLDRAFVIDFIKKRTDFKSNWIGKYI
jgi:hypothetical protein